VWRAKVYERDAYVCRICHKAVKRDALVPHPKAPTLDHIVPLADGGLHCYANVQLAHFMCNSRKSAGNAQLNLNLVRHG
jgi:5-methylcytosine-specific restriction endonuclease McrA